MTRDEVAAAIESIRLVQLTPDQIVVIRVTDRAVSASVLAGMRDQVRELLPGRRVIILAPGVEWGA